VQGWYGYLPERYVLQPGFADGHSVFVLGYSAHVFRGRGGFYVMDPLGRAGYSGAWWPSDVLRAYGWSGKPGHAGEGSKLSYLGFVALQAHPSAKKPMSPAGRPAFQNYWQTTKDALEAALTVIIMSGHGSNLPAIRGVVLFIRDPRLNLTAAKAQQSNALGWPVAGKVTILRGFSARHPDLALAPGPHSRVLAAAAGRIIFESRRNATGTVTLWIEHGPDLFTVYSGLGHVDVKPGEWVSKGGLLGSLGTSRAALLFSISVGALPTSTSGHVNPARFLSLS
jgi:murein DD-endopeptidase MepM/ murein hydrolase activator NlpD